MAKMETDASHTASGIRYRKDEEEENGERPPGGTHSSNREERG